MSVAQRYNLVFEVSEGSGLRRPYISNPLINGQSKNHEIASFLEPNGIKYVNEIISDIDSFNYDNPIDDYQIWGYHEDESFEIRNLPPAPPVAVFNTGGTEVEVPISDFLQILQEWKDFVAAVPTPHWLDGR